MFENCGLQKLRMVYNVNVTWLSIDTMSLFKFYKYLYYVNFRSVISKMSQNGVYGNNIFIFLLSNWKLHQRNWHNILWTIKSSHLQRITFLNYMINIQHCNYIVVVLQSRYLLSAKYSSNKSFFYAKRQDRKKVLVRLSQLWSTTQ